VSAVLPDPRWLAGSPRLRAAVAAAARDILSHEARVGARKQRRRDYELAAFFREVERLVCNVAVLRIANATDAPLAMSRWHRGHGGSKTRTRLLDTATDAGLIEMAAKGYSRSDGARFATLWRPLPALLDYLPNALRLGDFELARDPLPRIRIRDAFRNLLALPAEAEPMAADMAALDAWGKTLPLSLENCGAEAWLEELSETSDLAGVVTPLHLDLYRTFNGGLAKGGRIYGGFWIQMRKAERFARLRLAGERIAECDFSAMHLRLAYRHFGILWPFAEGEDAYTAGAGDRDGWKPLTNALLQARKPLRQWPGRNNVERAAYRATFPPGSLPSRLVAAIKTRHAALAAAGAFERGIGGFLTRVESDLMVALLLKCRARDLPALPVHDCLLAPASRADEAASLMRATARSRLGIELPVGITRVTAPRSAGLTSA
jgi:hypothetical protein